MAKPMSLSKAEIVDIRRKHIGSSCPLFFSAEPLYVARARGQYMYDENDVRYLDCINNVAHVGHCHPAVVEAASRQMAELYTNSRFLHPNMALLAKKLTSLLPGNLSVCYFVNSGSEANDLALILARAYTGANDVIVVDQAYHGITVAVTGMSPYKYNENITKPDWVHVVPSPDVYRGKYTDVNSAGEDLGVKYAGEVQAAIEAAEAGGRKIAAFLSESLQSCAGQILPPAGYLSAVYSAVRKAGGVCIADEVQTGFGRVGTHWWAFETQGVQPDIVTLGKPMGNGHPVSCVITTPQIAEAFTKLQDDFFSTFGGNPVSCAIALAVIDVIEKEGLRDNALQVGKYLLDKFKQLHQNHRLIGDVRGIGLFAGIELVQDRATRQPASKSLAKTVLRRLRDEHILFSLDGPDENVLKFKSPMCFAMSDVDLIYTALDKILSDLEA